MDGRLDRERAHHAVQRHYIIWQGGKIDVHARACPKVRRKARRMRLRSANPFAER